MKGQSFLVVSVLVVAASAACNGLAIGFDIDTPLDPFLGSLSKIKRHLVRRIKDLSTDDTFLNACPADQLGMIFSQPTFPPLFFPDQVQISPQSPLTSQLPLSSSDQRKLRFGQASLSFQAPSAQQFDSQLSAFSTPVQNQQSTKRSAYPTLFGLTQLPNLVQQLTQILPATFNAPYANQRQRFV